MSAEKGCGYCNIGHWYSGKNTHTDVCQDDGSIVKRPCIANTHYCYQFDGGQRLIAMDEKFDPSFVPDWCPIKKDAEIKALVAERDAELKSNVAEKAAEKRIEEKKVKPLIMPIDRTPQIIAVEINSIKDQARKLLLASSIEIGRRLTEAKNMLDHGQFMAWLKESVDYSQSTANNLMRIFEEYGANQISLFGEANSQALGNLSYTQAVALLGIEADQREEFVKENNVNELSTRDLQQLIKEKQEAIAKSGELEAENALLSEAKTKLESDQKLLTQSLKNANANTKITQEELTKAKAAAAAKERELQEALDELKEELNKPISLEPAVTETIPDEVQQELERYRNMPAPKCPAISKFTAHFQTLKDTYQYMLEALAAIEEEDPPAHEKYTGAVKKLLDIMAGQLN